MVNENMKISSNGRNLIKEFEGMELTAYQDSIGVWTIGYGHTKGVYKGMQISEQQANWFLDEDIKTHALGIFTFVTVQLNQNQFDALVSFHFNLGAYILQGSTLLTYINNKNWQAAANEMNAYVNAGGQVLAGLVRRRKRETELFLSAISPPIDGGLSQKKGEVNMQCIYWKPSATNPNPSNAFYFNGIDTVYIGSLDTIAILKTIYKDNNGKDMPEYKWNNNAPWHLRLEAVAPNRKQ